MSDAPVPHSTEQTEASLPVTLKAGFMGVKSRPFALVITNHRLIFARLTGSELKRRTAELKQRAKDEGRGRIARTFAGSGAYSEFARECAAMHPTDLLAQHPKNFAVDRTTVTKVKLRTVYLQDSQTEDRLTIKTTGKNYKMALTHISIEHAHQALSMAGML